MDSAWDRCHLAIPCLYPVIKAVWQQDAKGAMRRSLRQN
jgi:hypothetical protein